MLFQRQARKTDNQRPGTHCRYWFYNIALQPFFLIFSLNLCSTCFFPRKQPAYTSSLIKLPATSSLVPHWTGDAEGWMPRTSHPLEGLGRISELLMLSPFCPKSHYCNKKQHLEAPAQNMGDLFVHKSAAKICGCHGLTMMGFSQGQMAQEWKFWPDG